jgi:hypothetical protein
MVKIIDAESLAEMKVENGLTRDSKVYLGNAKDNLTAQNARTAKVLVNSSTGAAVEVDAMPYKVGSKGWKNSAGRFELYKDLNVLQNRIKEAEDSVKNAGGQPPSAADMATYLALTFIDIQRLRDELADLTPEIYNVRFNENFPEDPRLRDLLPYVGKEEELKLTGDSVPLIQQAGVEAETVTLKVKGFGWAESLRNIIFNPFDTQDRLNQAVATIGVDSRNNDIIGNLVGLTYPALQTVAADTGGATYDLKVYNTLLKVLDALAILKHPLTDQVLSKLGIYANKVKLLLHPADAWSVARVANGGLIAAGGVQQIVAALPFAGILSYGGGIMDGMKWGEKTLSLPGVAKGYGYAYLPNPMAGFDLTKRETTMEVSQGDAIQLGASVDRKAWYRINGLHHDYFTGGAKDNTNSGKGCIVKFSLPSR